MCLNVFMCVCACGRIVVELRVRTLRHHRSSARHGCIVSPLAPDSQTLVIIHCPPTIASELPQGPHQGQASTSAKWEHEAHTLTHTRIGSFIFASPVTLSLCLAGKWDCVELNI